MPLNINIKEYFQTAFEKNCYRLTIEAYNSLLRENIMQLDWNENDITQELYEKIDNNPKRLQFKITASREFHLSDTRSKEKGFADKLSRVDLKMSNISFELEFEYFFEAKRLKEKDSNLKRYYINTGMNSFISNKYPR